MQKYNLILDGVVVASFDNLALAELEQEVYLLEAGIKTTILVQVV